MTDGMSRSRLYRAKKLFLDGGKNLFANCWGERERERERIPRISITRFGLDNCIKFERKWSGWLAN